jgi:mitochondrial import inner membrane translocase subunit TIM17
MRAPVLGGNFGVSFDLSYSCNTSLQGEQTWGGLFSLSDCAIKGLRKKEDPWNAIGAGFMTGGALAVRGGFKAMRNGAITCAILLAVIEGVGIGFSKMMAGGTKLEVSSSMRWWTPLEY